MPIIGRRRESPVGFTSSAKLVDCIAVPSKHRRDSTDEGENPDEHKAQCCMFDSQTDIFQRATDHKETFKSQDCQRPESNNSYKAKSYILHCSGGHTVHTKEWELHNYAKKLSLREGLAFIHVPLISL